MGYDRRIDPVRRSLARILSLYERASLRLLLSSEAIGPLDAGLVMAARWALLKAADRIIDVPVEPVTSGWAGNLLFLGVWAALVMILAMLLS